MSIPKVNIKNAYYFVFMTLYLVYSYVTDE